VWSGLNQKRRMLVLNYLRETHLIDALGLGDLSAQLEQPAGRRMERPENSLRTAKQHVDALENWLVDANRRIAELRDAVGAADDQLTHEIIPYLTSAAQRIDYGRAHPEGAVENVVELQDTYHSIETYLAEDVHGTLARTYISLDGLGNALRRAADRSDNVTPR
jgi:hypothetical protein